MLYLCLQRRYLSSLFALTRLHHFVLIHTPLSLSSMSLPSYAEVLIVGAGPTGLALAVSLAIRGIDAVLVDERPDGQRTSRAAWVHSRTLEVCSRFHVTGMCR